MEEHVEEAKLFWTIIIGIVLRSKKYFCRQNLYKYI